MADQNKKQSGGFNPIGLCLGMGVGLCFGVAMDNIALGISMGLLFSVALGQHADSDSKQDEKPGEDKQ